MIYRFNQLPKIKEMENENWFMKKPCQHCPYRSDVKPFLHPERGEELAYLACNPYSSFPCHKTTVEDEDSEDGEMRVTPNSKMCAGFMTLQINEGMDIPEGFTPAYDIVYSDCYEMADAYSQEENS